MLLLLASRLLHTLQQLGHAWKQVRSAELGSQLRSLTAQLQQGLRPPSTS